MEDRCDAWEDMILSADLFGKMRFKVAEMFEMVGGRGR